MPFLNPKNFNNDHYWIDTDFAFSYRFDRTHPDPGALYEQRFYGKKAYDAGSIGMARKVDL